MFVLASARPELGDTQPNLLVERGGRTRDRTRRAERRRQRDARLRARRTARGARPPPLCRRAAGREGARQPALPRGDRPHARRRRRARRRRASSRYPCRRACRRWSRPDSMVCPATSAASPSTPPWPGMTFWSGAAALLDDRPEPPNDLLESLAGRTVLHEHGASAVAGEREWEFKHVRDPRRRVRAAAEEPPRRPPRPLRRLDRRAAGRKRGVRRDPRLPPRAGVPRRTRGRPVGGAAARRPRGRGAHRTQARRRNDREGAARGARLLFARARRWSRRRSRNCARAPSPPRARAGGARGAPRWRATSWQSVADEARDLGLDAIRCEALVAFGNVAWKQGGAAQAETRARRGRGSGVEDRQSPPGDQGIVRVGMGEELVRRRGRGSGRKAEDVARARHRPKATSHSRSRGCSASR